MLSDGKYSMFRIKSYRTSNGKTTVISTEDYVLINNVDDVRWLNDISEKDWKKLSTKPSVQLEKSCYEFEIHFYQNIHKGSYYRVCRYEMKNGAQDKTKYYYKRVGKM